MNKHDNELPLAAADVQADPSRKSGRVAFDAGGRSIWEWQTATGVFTRNVTEDQLTTLSAVELQIVESPPQGTHDAMVYGGKRASLPTRMLPKQSSSGMGQKKTAGGVAAWLKRHLAGLN